MVRVRHRAGISVIVWTFWHTGGTPNVWPKMTTMMVFEICKQAETDMVITILGTPPEGDVELPTAPYHVRLFML